MRGKADVKAIACKLLEKLGYEIHSRAHMDLLRQWQVPGGPPGHFYSPYPDLDHLRAHEQRIFSPDKPVLDVDLREEQQWELLKTIAELYPTIPFTAKRTSNLRYWYENPNYSYGDGIVLHGMLRILKPKALLEVGSGYSTAATLDTNEMFLENSIQVTCIEPYPELMLSLLKPGDRERIRLIAEKLQDLDVATFEILSAGDVLFIDSTHVSKTDSDVNFLLFEVLPSLKRGVWIHFHDVFYPFEYPKEWVYGGRAWQELYLLRVLLQTPSAYRIRYFQDMMFHKHRAFFESHLPLCLTCGGGDLWLEKV